MAGGDPTARKRKSADDALAAKKDVVRLHLEGVSVREIGRRVGLGHMSVWRLIKQYEAALAARYGGDDDLDDEDVDAAQFLVDQLTPQLSAEDVRSRAEFDQLNPLERFRWCHLPRDHPAKAI